MPLTETQIKALKPGEKARKVADEKGLYLLVQPGGGKLWRLKSGETRYKDAVHLWAFKHIAERADNLVCAVLVLEDAVVVKTVMHHFSLEV